MPDLNYLRPSKNPEHGLMELANTYGVVGFMGHKLNEMELAELLCKAFHNVHQERVNGFSFYSHTHDPVYHRVYYIHDEMPRTTMARVQKVFEYIDGRSRVIDGPFIHMDKVAEFVVSMNKMFSHNLHS